MKEITLSVALLMLFVLSASLDAKEQERPDDALEKIRNRCRTVLNKAVVSEEAFVRSGAVRAMGESKLPEFLPRLKKSTEDFYPTARLFALQALEEISEKEAEEAAKKMLGDTNVWVRTAAIDYLGKTKNPEHADLIVALLNSPDRMIRLSSANALYRLGEEKYLNDIFDSLKGGDIVHRYQAIHYLGEINSSETLTRLEKILTDESEDEILFYTLKAIDTNVRIELIKTLDRLAKHKNPSVRQQAILKFGHLPRKTGIERLKPFCKDIDPMVKLSAAITLSRLKSSSCLEIFDVSIQHADFGVRSVAARIMGEVAIPSRLRLLAKALKDPNSRVKTAAVRAVGKIGGAGSFKLLLSALDDSVEVVRAYAAGHILRLVAD